MYNSVIADRYSKTSHIQTHECLDYPNTNIHGLLNGILYLVHRGSNISHGPNVLIFWPVLIAFPHSFHVHSQRWDWFHHLGHNR